MKNTCELEKDGSLSVVGQDGKEIHVVSNGENKEDSVKKGVVVNEKGEDVNVVETVRGDCSGSMNGDSETTVLVSPKSSNGGIKELDVVDKGMSKKETVEQTARMCQMSVGRMGFARVLVEMNATKEIPEMIEVVYRNGQKEELCRKKVKVEFDWTPPRCATCCIFGHTDQKCGKKISVEETNKPKECTENKEMNADDGFEEVRNKKNGGKVDNRKQNKQVQQPEVGRKQPKHAAQFVYQPKSNTNGVNNSRSGNSNVQKENGKKEVQNTSIKTLEKKAWKVGNEVVSELRRSANKYSVLGEYDVNEQSELEDLRSKEIVDDFIRQQKNPTENELTKWTIDMIGYFNKRKEQVRGKGKKVELNVGVTGEESDVYQDES
ncbi:zinc knuckle CX2CX4HX4C [Artemisia annua]|uniref:Zinc knuckle CX2CX4HX4C n=1 Tax=Artemisia annua TaxID=35608 RepID=A0A2U1Q4J3_ARTAN|nr:zinc knuckle CX2CX4HX4C [Artemisia annua]